MPDLQPMWGGPVAASAAGIDLPVCAWCRRRLPHSWPEHVAQVEATTDPLARAGFDQGAVA